ncbi:P-loop containing nucleoside triphosphate hydrolase protein [Periconia macrospinosa]|uniref:Kinesin-like protein n=1 Tax=Periconia macrospinosa TaxID=97972 RepID=A0A2V1EBF1_9PLEO|nr:P-loop containing nucleoside triphosphate hydrolase protein [Periconia macrospinosa]
MAMEPPPRPSSSLFDVYLRLRPSRSANARFLTVEENEAAHPTHITIKPPTSDNRKRAVERHAFTRVFEEDAEQLDLFSGIGAVPIIEGVLGARGHHGRDGLIATLGVTGSGKSHTILGTRSQRGITQMALQVLFQSTGEQLVQSFYGAPAFSSLAAADVSESNMFTATAFLDSLYGDDQLERFPSRGNTPMPSTFSSRLSARIHSIRPVTGTLSRISRSMANPSSPPKKDCSSFITNGGSRRTNKVPRPSTLPQTPDMDHVSIPVDTTAEFAIIISMYEVYNDRIFDLLTGSAMKNKHPNLKRRALLFKSTEQSTDRKVVAGLTKIICGSFEEALMVLETGLVERKVAGTGSNAVSSRSHGFFCVEVKKRDMERKGPWSSSTLTIVDLAGSERARHAKTAGETLAEAGKINESLMYLGQCMQMQSDNQGGSKNIIPFRQCKLTELLFSNSFPSSSRQTYHHPQKSIMIVNADPKGDFNATSQILRYSALAREVTVPRIPSTTSTILAGGPIVHGHKHTSSSASSGRTTPSGRATPSGRITPSAILDELDASNAEIARLTAEMEIFAMRLAEETARRKAAEHSWRAAEDRMADREQEIRDECHAFTEAAVESERRRWQAALDSELENQQVHLDNKIDIVISATKAQLRSKGAGAEVKVYEDPDPRLQDRVAELERQNDMLKAKLECKEREGQMKSSSPIKKMRVLKAKRWEDPGLGGEE